MMIPRIVVNRFLFYFVVVILPHGEVTTYDDAMALWLWMDSGYRKNLVSCYDLHFTPETLH